MPSAATSEGTSLDVTDDVRQSILLAEGVARSLVGGEENRTLGIDCFHQLEDWPGSAATEAYRQQATYNEAIVWRQSGSYGRCVLLLTELLGERAPDTVSSASPAATINSERAPVLPDAIRIPARVARLAAFAQYTRDDWSTLPDSRAELLINDAGNLVEDLDGLSSRDDISAHDRRLARYMYVEALRCTGHVELLRVITGPARSLYHDQRPTGLLNGSLNEQARKLLERAVSRLLTCEQIAPTSGLFGDLAEAYLLLKDFSAAQGYARHATLESGTANEWAYYLATESFYLQNDDASRLLAREYAEKFTGPVTLEQFKSVRADLGMS